MCALAVVREIDAGDGENPSNDDERNADRRVRDRVRRARRRRAAGSNWNKLAEQRDARNTGGRSTDREPHRTSRARDFVTRAVIDTCAASSLLGKSKRHTFFGSSCTTIIAARALTHASAPSRTRARRPSRGDATPAAPRRATKARTKSSAACAGIRRNSRDDCERDQPRLHDSIARSTRFQRNHA